MTERVTVIRGKAPIIFVSPHAPEEKYTDNIAVAAAEKASGSAIINNGFRRWQYVDVLKNKANCHRIDHVMEDVVEDEFLSPLRRMVKRYIYKLTKGRSAYWIDEIPKRIQIYYIHGCDNRVHKMVADDVGCIIGYGLGKNKDSPTCEDWRVGAFACWFESFNCGTVYQGMPSGIWSAHGKRNMTQYFSAYEKQPLVSSMQLEFPLSMRSNPLDSLATGQVLGSTATTMDSLYDDSLRKVKIPFI